MAWAFDPQHSLVRILDIEHVDLVWMWYCPECPRGMSYERVRADPQAITTELCVRVERVLQAQGTRHLLTYHPDVPYVRREALRQAREKRIAAWWAGKHPRPRLRLAGVN